MPDIRVIVIHRGGLNPKKAIRLLKTFESPKYELSLHLCSPTGEQRKIIEIAEAAALYLPLTVHTAKSIRREHMLPGALSALARCDHLADRPLARLEVRKATEDIPD